MPDSGSRFSGVAGQYDLVRPPADLVAMITQWAGVARPDVVDLGAGTGLSTVIWAGHARQVTAVEPYSGMRHHAERRIREAGTGSGTRFTIAAATAEETGLPDGCADVVTASQAMHWFDPDRALPEIARLVRPGRHCAEIAVHGREQGDADRLVALAHSAITHPADFLGDGPAEEYLGITSLRETAARRLGKPLTWWWTYRVRLAIR
jgi:ubiquinone/menaquinone biosynthesis C-methylase UbiE